MDRDAALELTRWLIETSAHEPVRL